MPDTSLSQAIKEAYAAAPSSAVTLHTLEFNHPAFTQPLRVVRDFVDHNCTLEANAPVNAGQSVLFVGFAFDIVLPEVSDAASPEVEISIDNVSLEIEDNIRAALQTSDLVTVIYRPYLLSDLSTPQMDPPLSLTVTSVSADAYRLTARAQLGDFSNKRFPTEEYTGSRFPGLVR